MTTKPTSPCGQKRNVHLGVAFHRFYLHCSVMFIVVKLFFSLFDVIASHATGQYIHVEFK